MWLQTKVSKKEGHSHSTLNWRNFECELCKTPYPYTFLLDNSRWFLVDLNRPQDNDTPYIILESLSSEKNSSRTIHIVIINSEQSSFSLGRGHDSELRINDISVSRKHASLEYKDGKFVLSDLKSKFGTLMLISEPVQLSEHNNKTFQIGRTVVTIKAKSEAPWRRRNNDRGMNIDSEIKGPELQKMEELLRDTNSLGKTHYNRVNEINAEEKSAKIITSENGSQNKVIEVDGKRYIILKELDNEGENDIQE